MLINTLSLFAFSKSSKTTFGQSTLKTARNSLRESKGIWSTWTCRNRINHNNSNKYSKSKYSQQHHINKVIKDLLASLHKGKEYWRKMSRKAPCNQLISKKSSIISRYTALALKMIYLSITLIASWSSTKRQSSSIQPFPMTNSWITWAVWRNFFRDLIFNL